ncbi:DUF7848 domain-containing protein [Streptomyces sp. 4N509B]|uniref:DUF7848 domain-containing protein n=1 Tax=Streptomyces sp. 4N509B TaxID=3457413 RepID=UPI003FCFFB35
MLCAERAEGAPAALCRAVCLTCGAESDLSWDDQKPVRVWALEHARARGLAHHQFRVTAHDYWRVDPLHAPVGAAPWPPPNRAPAVAAPAAPEAPPPRRTAAHAKRRGWWRGRRAALRTVAVVAGLAAGPLTLLTALVVGSPLLGGRGPASTASAIAHAFREADQLPTERSREASSQSWAAPRVAVSPVASATRVQ